MVSNLIASAPKHRERRVLRLCACFILTVAILLTGLPADSSRADDAMTAQIKVLVPELEAYIANGMTAFDNPGLAIGIVTEEGLVYAALHKLPPDRHQARPHLTRQARLVALP
jgi:hypothetical protein